MNRVNSLSRYLDSGLSLGWWRLFVYGVFAVVVIAVLVVDVFLSLVLGTASVVTWGIQLFRRRWLHSPILPDALMRQRCHAP